MLAPPSVDMMNNVRGKIKPELLSAHELQEMTLDLMNEVHTDYQTSLKKGIGKQFAYYE